MENREANHTMTEAISGLAAEMREAAEPMVGGSDWHRGYEYACRKYGGLLDSISAPCHTLSERDRADIRRELTIRAEQCDDTAVRAQINALGDYSASVEWRDRAQRIRELIALLGGEP